VDCQHLGERLLRFVEERSEQMGSGHVSQYAGRQARSLSHPSPLVGRPVLHAHSRLSHLCTHVDQWWPAMIERALPPAYHVIVRRFSSLLADARENQLKGKRNPLWLSRAGCFICASPIYGPLAGDSEMPLKRQNLNGARPGAGAFAGLPL
jgi:hypothetical protein